MFTCEHGHNILVVISKGSSCPLCAADHEIEQKEKIINELEDKIVVLEDEIQKMKGK